MIDKTRWLVCIGGAITTIAGQTAVQLDIPPRLQWPEKNGYCGECSVQQIALSYGTYISQYNVRQITDPTQAQDILVPADTGPVLDALRLNHTDWNSSQGAPQYANYLVWIKSHLQQGHPVIMGVYINGLSDPDYDHIIPATGFNSTDTNAYHASDTLVFNDNFSATPFSRTCGTIWATRSAANSGSYDHYIPRDVDYGTAVTGITDPAGTTKPVSLTVDRWDEPDPWQSQPPVQMNATIQISGLTAGNTYMLLRYNNYANVPTSNFLASAYSSATSFVATNSTHTLNDSFMSSATVIYRAVPAQLNAPYITSVRVSGTDVRLQFTTQSNGVYGVDYRGNLTTGSWTSLVTNIIGTGGTMTFTNTNAVSVGSRFYRIWGAAP